MKAIIISIGSELTEGLYPDTNSQKLSLRLASVGVDVIRTVIVPDELDIIKRTVFAAFYDSDLVITTGGLGPTDDDLTRKAFSEAFSLPLELNRKELARIKSLITSKGYPYSKDNNRQAYFPKTSEMILNEEGTASGFYLVEINRIIFALPGVPNQALKMFDHFIVEKIDAKQKVKTKSLTVKTFNITESMLNSKFRENIDAANLIWGTLAKHDGIYLKVKAKGDNAVDIISTAKRDIDALFKGKIWGYDDDELSLMCASALREKKLTISTAESCTGGLISKILTDISGSSDYFKGSIVSYSNETKISLLKVKKETIDKYGAVSEQTVKKMAKSCAKKLNTDIAISVSGIAGPSGGSKEKPLGTVYMCIKTPSETKVFHYFLPGNRDEIRKRTAYYALIQLLKMIK
jgi:nicotinamide-nucleotide amidase